MNEVKEKKKIGLTTKIFIALIASGAFLKLEAIWILADIVNGLMAIPNLIALLLLSPVVIKLTREHFKK